MKGMLKCKCEKNQKGVTPPIWDTWPFDGVPYCKKSQKIMHETVILTTDFREFEYSRTFPLLLLHVKNWIENSKVSKNCEKFQIEIPKISKCAGLLIEFFLTFFVLYLIEISRENFDVNTYSFPNASSHSSNSIIAST